MARSRGRDDSQRLLEATLHELAQAEHSAVRHGRAEAERLRNTPPGLAMEAISRHAAAMLPVLEAFGERLGVDTSVPRGVGHAFHVARHRFVDGLVRIERSYRGTLLGVRHGIDLTRLLREIAVTTGDVDLRHWADAWLARRLQLAAHAESAVAWFAKNPARALDSPRTGRGLRFARSALRAIRGPDAPLALPRG